MFGRRSLQMLLFGGSLLFLLAAAQSLSTPLRASGGGVQADDDFPHPAVSGERNQALTASIDFLDFTSLENLNLVGDAAQVDGKLRLTPAVEWQGGAAWYADKVLVDGSFDTFFEFQISNVGGPGSREPGGDGIAFVIQNESNLTLGTQGDQIGYGGISNSLAVEFDTWYNNWLVEPNNNHISVHTRGSTPNEAHHDYSLGSTAQIPNLSDGQIHTALISYVPGSLQVYLDDLAAPALSVSINLDQRLDLDNGKAWVGFTSSTGAAWEDHDILSWYLGDSLFYSPDLCAAATADQPLLLAPGWGGAPSLDADESGFAQLRAALEGIGYREGCNLSFVDQSVPEKTLDENAAAVRIQACILYNRVKKYDPYWNGHIDIIGHSYGGLHTRAFLENRIHYDDRGWYDDQGLNGLRGVQCGGEDRVPLVVDNLFTLGSPHLGGVSKTPAGLFTGIFFHGLDSREWGSIRQLGEEQMAYYNLSHLQPQNTCYRLVGGNAYDQELPPELHKFNEFFQSSENDLGVLYDSAVGLAGHPHYPKVYEYQTADVHCYIGDYDAGYEDLRTYVSPYPWETFYEAIEPYIGDGMNLCRPPQDGNSSVLTKSVQSTGLPVVPATLVAAGGLVSGQSDTGSFVVENSGSSTFYLNWPLGDYGLTLTDPDGVTHDPASVLSDPNVDYFEMKALGLNATYNFTDTLPGPWSYTISAMDVPTKTPYQLTHLPPLPVAVSVSASGWHRPGDPAAISAAVSHEGTPLNDATVSAAIYRPDGVTATLPLFDDGAHGDGAAGDGVYGSSYTAADVGGFYSVLAEASGLYGGEPYTRTDETTFTVTTGDALLSGVYSDQPLDAGGDGRYEGIAVTAGIDVMLAGSYTLAAELLSSTGARISQTNTGAVLPTGQTELTLAFPGADILLHGEDGPYTLSNLHLVDNGHGGLLMDEDSNVYDTAAYAYEQFDTYDAPCADATGVSATLEIPADVGITGSGVFAPGQQVAVFSEDGALCAAKGLYRGDALSLTVWGDDPGTPEKDGLLEGELFHLRLWDPASATEYRQVAASYRQGDGRFAAGTITILDSMALYPPVTQEIFLQGGWNMIAGRVWPEHAAVAEIFDALQDQLVLVKNGAGEVYWPAMGIDDISVWDSHAGFQVYMQTPATLTITGIELQPAAESVSLDAGWQLVGYWHKMPMRVPTALESVENAVVLIKNNHGQVFWPAYGIDQIGLMSPGNGYQLYLTGPAVLIYPG